MTGGSMTGGSRRRDRRRAAVAEPVQGAPARAYLRRGPDYRAAWVEHASLPRFEAAAFPLRVQTEADLAAAGDRALLAWEGYWAAAMLTPQTSISVDPPASWSNANAPLASPGTGTRKGERNLRLSPRPP